MVSSRLVTVTKVLLSVGLIGILGVVGFGQADEPHHAVEPGDSTELDLAGLDPTHAHLEGTHLVSTLPDERRVVWTFNPALQDHVREEFERYEVPFGAVVALDPQTGRVLAYVSHSSANPEAAGALLLDPTPPTASVFKIVTSSALIESGVSPDTRTCYHGGFRSLSLGELEDNAVADRLCASLPEALGSSINAVFAKLADRHLNPDVLARYARAFGFGQALPFDVATQPSPMEVPTERLEFARTAAGFWHMHMSPLHGALIAATIANAGRMPRAAMVETAQDADGNEIYRFAPSIARTAVRPETAATVGRMMRRTVTRGTARRTFHDPHGRPFLPGIEVAGKTGTLSARDPYRGYSWWVGFAPADAPTIAVAALVVNTPQWRIKASYMARETLRNYLVTQGHVERVTTSNAVDASDGLDGLNSLAPVSTDVSNAALENRR